MLSLRFCLPCIIQPPSLVIGTYMHTWLQHRNKKPISPVGGSVHIGGSGNYANLISSPSSGNLAAYLDAQRSLPTLGEAEDLLVRAVFVI